MITASVMKGLIATKRPILDACQGSEYASNINKSIKIIRLTITLMVSLGFNGLFENKLNRVIPYLI